MMFCIEPDDYRGRSKHSAVRATARISDLAELAAIDYPFRT